MSAAQSEHVKRWIIIIIIIITIVIVYHPTDDIIIENFAAFDIEQAWNKIHVHFCTGVYGQNRFAVCILFAGIQIIIIYFRCMPFHILMVVTFKNIIIWIRNTVAFQSPHYFLQQTYATSKCTVKGAQV